MAKVSVFLFDLGNVLMGWDPHRLFDKLLPNTQTCETFLKTFMPYNAERDKGTWHEAAPFLDEPNPLYRDLYQTYSKRYTESLSAPFDGTVEILRQVKQAGYRTYAASNWAADTFESARPHMPFLSLFDGMQISGQVGLIKPSAAFFEHMMKTFAFTPEEAFFIDDSQPNVEAAQKLGIASHLFSSPDLLAQDLKERGLLKND